MFSTLLADQHASGDKADKLPRMDMSPGRLAR
jgi:hypothetical protein